VESRCTGRIPVANRTERSRSEGRMKTIYCLVLSESEFKWLRAWINAGVSPESEGASVLRKIEQLAEDDRPKPQRVFP
jgi:hypothetical protein